MEQWTIKKLLEWITGFLTGKSVDAPRLSAELLLSHALNLQRIELYTNFDKVIPPDKLAELRAMVKRASEHEPIAYLVGRTEFYSMTIKVSPDTLIPRPETELLVERAIEFLRTRQNTQHILDLCTGSGCIAAAITNNFPNADIVATDICDAALSIAAENIKTHNLTERVKLLCGDLFSPIIAGLDAPQFDLITCNPPYIADHEYPNLDKNVRDYEPQKALLAGPEGLDIYKKIADKIKDFLKPDGALILEIGQTQAPAVTNLLEQTAVFTQIKVEKDYQNNDRIVTAIR